MVDIIERKKLLWFRKSTNEVNFFSFDVITMEFRVGTQWCNCSFRFRKWKESVAVLCNWHSRCKCDLETGIESSAFIKNCLERIIGIAGCYIHITWETKLRRKSRFLQLNVTYSPLQQLYSFSLHRREKRRGSSFLCLCGYYLKRQMRQGGAAPTTLHINDCVSVHWVRGLASGSPG